MTIVIVAHGAVLGARIACTLARPRRFPAVSECMAALSRSTPNAPPPSRAVEACSSHSAPLPRPQAHMRGAEMPIADYVNDAMSVLDQAPRVLNVRGPRCNSAAARQTSATTRPLRRRWWTSRATWGCWSRACDACTSASACCRAAGRRRARWRSFRTWTTAPCRGFRGRCVAAARPDFPCRAMSHRRGTPCSRASPACLSWSTPQPTTSAASSPAACQLLR